MFYKLDNKEMKLIDKASEISCTDYDLTGNFIPVENMMSIIEDLLLELDAMQERYDDLEADLEQNYRQIPLSEQYGIRNSDFY